MTRQPRFCYGASHPLRSRRMGPCLGRFLLFFALSVLANAALEGAEQGPLASTASSPSPPSPIVHIVGPAERLEMLVNTSRILTLPHRIPEAMVNNKELLSIAALSPTQYQISAKKAGVTQVNLWDEQGQIYTIDVVITGDARELTALLTSEFPSAAIKVRPVSNGVLISGFVDRPEDADRIRQLAEEYYPKVINNITVAGVQQVLLHIKVYEVSRTKLRNLGFDFAQVSTPGGFVSSSISQMLAGGGSTAVTGPSSFAFQAVSGNSSFFGVLNALRQNDLAKVLSEPTLVTQSGRPAYFRVGGEIPYSVSQGLGAVSIEWKSYGTRVDFVPFVLGNGKIRLEVRPQVSEVDNTRSLVAGVPAIKVRETDTGVELEAGQTLAIAGLVQTRVEAQNRGLPWVSEVPYLGALFRRVREENNDIETLILVTPEIVDGVAPHEVPANPPGTNSTSPSDWQLYMLGKVEVPNGGSVEEGTFYDNAGELGNGQDTARPASGAIQRPMTPAVPPPRPRPELQAPAGNEGHTGVQGAAATTPVNPRPLNRGGNAKPPRASNSAGPGDKSGGLPGFLGPIGYDMGE
jgi:pilus assembly protein CpaC